jgi:hypothetical protein
MFLRIGILFLQFVLIVIGTRQDKDHPKIHFPKRADTAHEGCFGQLQFHLQSVKVALQGDPNV